MEINVPESAATRHPDFGKFVINMANYDGAAAWSKSDIEITVLLERARPTPLIVIPSRERARWLMARERSSTLINLMGLPTRLYVRDDDSQLKDYENYASIYNVDLKVRPMTAAGVWGCAQTYDYVMEELIREGVERAVFLDDDLDFGTLDYDQPEIGRLRRPTGTQLNDLLWLWAETMSPEFPASSLPPVIARSQKRLINWCKPLERARAYYLPHFDEHPTHRYWTSREIEARCDLDLTLKMLGEGFLNGYFALLFTPCEVNHPGGCSLYRDLQLEEASVSYLLKTYPRSVRVRDKRGWGGDPSVIRRAPVIQWKKAFSQGAFERRFGDLIGFLGETQGRLIEEYQTLLDEWRGEVY